MKFEKTTLVGINASFSHTAYAIYCLARMKPKTNLSIVESTTSVHHDDLLRRLFEENADLYGFSTYIWNIESILRIIQDLKVLLPNAKILLGGPEVSFDAVKYMEEYPSIDYILAGEGETSFPLLFTEDMQSVPNLYYRNQGIQSPYVFSVPDLATLPPVYHDFTFENHKMYYYEASRGCPYHCSFCLSQSQKVREVPLEQVKEELTVLANQKLDRIKFIDRTMNANPKRFKEMIEFIQSIDNGHTNFHMEIHPAVLKENQIEQLNALRPGLVQFEIGVQSTNPNTCEEISRVGKTEQIAQVVAALRKPGNIHLHLDLIAGLPHENLLSFGKSFDDVMAMQPHKLQLGFLKLLHGTKLREEKKKFGIIHTKTAPYEVLQTDDISASELYFLHDVAKLVDLLYNEQWLEKTLLLLKEQTGGWWNLFSQLAIYFKEHLSRNVSKDAWYDLLFTFGRHVGIDEEIIKDFLHFDAYVHRAKQPKGNIVKMRPLTMEEFKEESVQNALKKKWGEVSSLYKKTRRYDFSYEVHSYEENKVKRNRHSLLFIDGEFVEIEEKGNLWTI